MSESATRGDVLEHLPDPSAALEKRAALTNRSLLISVPRQPIWRALNMMRGKYLIRLGGAGARKPSSRCSASISTSWSYDSHCPGRWCSARSGRHRRQTMET